MTREFLLPDLGEGLTEAEIVAWLVQPGDEVAVDQPIVELESAKSVVQLPTPYAGVVETLGGEVGQTIHAGSVLLRLGERADAATGPADASDIAAEAGAGTAAAPVAAADTAVTPVASTPAATVPGTAVAEESGAVLIGYGTRASAATKRAADAPSRFGRRGTGSRPPARPDAAAAPALDPGRRSPVVSPIVRRLAREHGFDAAQLEGTGPDHLVVRRDVERFIAERAGAGGAAVAGRTADALVDAGMGATAPDAAQPGAASVASAAPAASAAPVLEDRRVPLDRTQRAAAAHFSRSRREIPEATVWMDVDATGLLAAREELATATGERFGISALIARIVVAGLRRHPELNASFDAERDELVLHGAVNLGLAAQTPRGLMVPVVHGAERMSLRELRDAVGARGDEAKRGVFPPSALSGGTFTLNNYGVLGVDGSAAIINHPEVAMLGVGRFVPRPWVVDGELAVRTVTELTISFDHRACDGAVAAAFLTYVAGCIERPLALLADV